MNGRGCFSALDKYSRKESARLGEIWDSFHLKWMFEKKIEENQGMMKEEVMKDGMKRGGVREENSLYEILDFGKHVGKSFRQVYMEDPGYCDWAVRQIKPGAVKLN